MSFNSLISIYLLNGRPIAGYTSWMRQLILNELHCLYGEQGWETTSD